MASLAAQNLCLRRLPQELAHPMFANQSFDARAQLGRKPDVS
jgi:hypothetical protein